MREQELGHTRFREPGQGWDLPPVGTLGFESSLDGIKVSATPDRTLQVNGPGVHARNGDSIELRFRNLGPESGGLEFGFDADRHEYARVELDFENATASLATSDWTAPQPVASAPVSVSGHGPTPCSSRSGRAGGISSRARTSASTSTASRYSRRTVWTCCQRWA